MAWADTNSSSASDSGNAVKVGAGSSASKPGRPGRSVHRSGGGKRRASAAPACTYIPLPASQAAAFGPGGPTPGSWYFVKCPGRKLTIYTGALSWFPSASPVKAIPPAVAPSALALQATNLLTLPSPIVNLNPSAFSIVNLSSWLWIDPQTWHSFRATATAGGVSATAIATPVSVSWSMGDGHTVVCDGPGTPYDPAIPEAAQSTACSYTFLEVVSWSAEPGWRFERRSFQRVGHHHLDCELVSDRGSGGRAASPASHRFHGPRSSGASRISRNSRLAAERRL